MQKAKLIARGKTLEVDFNPDSLSIRHQTFGEEGRRAAPSGESSAPTSGGAADRSSSAAGLSSRLAQVELLFDSSDFGTDVRRKTLQILEMMTPVKNVPPVVRFVWGDLIFKGRITGFTETLAYFSEHGVPLRAKVHIDLTEANEERASDRISNANSGAGASASASLGASIGASAGISASASAGASFGASAGLTADASLSASVSAGVSAGASIGATPLTFSQNGESLQSLSARAGLDWRTVAAANNIENPRLLQPGVVVNLNVK